MSRLTKCDICGQISSESYLKSHNPPNYCVPQLDQRADRTRIFVRRYRRPQYLGASPRATGRACLLQVS
jgi:hypothetical protein